MKLNSIFTKISVIFLFSLIFLITLFIFYLKIQKDQHNELIISFHKGFSQTLREKRLPPKELIELIEKSNFELEYEHMEVFKNARILYQQRDFETLIVDKTYYFHVVTPRFRILFKDLNIYDKSNLMYILFASFLIILIFLYIWLLKSLKPLKDLRESISKFSNGDLNIDCRSEQKDEIGDVSNEFDKAVKKIDLLLESRQLFLRTIMHELKTPIAKGRIVSELINDSKQSKRLISIFEKLDFQINDFAKVEQIVSNNFELQKRSYYLKEILSSSKKMLMNKKVDNDIEIVIDLNKKISCDNDLISLVFKNLIDNAFRYSEDGKVKIIQNKDDILFISKGYKLEKDFEEYFKPFHTSAKSKNHGMGLGLYIIKSILDRHNMQFNYSYKEGCNIFIIQT